MEDILVSYIECSCGVASHHLEAIWRPEAQPGQPREGKHMEFEVAVVKKGETRQSITLDRAGMQHLFEEIALLLKGVDDKGCLHPLAPRQSRIGG